MKIAIMTALRDVGHPVFGKLVKHANRCNELVKFYYEITEDCGTQGILDGRTLGGDAFSLENDQQRLGLAFEKMIANVPYYAIMLLHDPRAFDMDTYEERCAYLLRTTFIENTQIVPSKTIERHFENKGKREQSNWLKSNLYLLIIMLLVLALLINRK